MLSLNSCHKDYTDIDIVIPDNYFSGISIDKINDIEYISHLESADNMTYVAGPLSNLICDKVIDIYDCVSKELKSVKLEFNECYSIDALYADETVIYVGYRDGNHKARAGVFSKFTGEELNDIPLSDSHYVYSFFKDSSEKVYINMVSTMGFNLDSITKIYDQSLNYQSEIDLCDKMNLSAGEKPVRVLSDMNGGYYILTLNTKPKLTPSIYRVSESFEVKYSIDDFSDMSGDLESICINQDQNLLIIFKDKDTNTYFINESDSENGEVLERYECTFGDDTSLTGTIMNSVGQSSRKYDFYISKNDGIYGYVLKTDCCERVCYNTYGRVPDCAFIENDNVYTYYSQSGNNCFAVCELDENGDVANNVILETDKGYLGDILIDNRQNIYFTQIIDDTQIAICDTQNTICTISADETINLFCDLYTDDDDCFHIGYITETTDAEGIFFNYLVCDKNGKSIFSKKYSVNSYNCRLLPSFSDNTFKVIYTDPEGEVIVNNISYKTNKEISTKHRINSDAILEMYRGDESFDFYYSTANSVYGYSESERKSEEIINWNNSQLYVNPDKICIKNNSSLVCTTFDEDNSYGKVCFLNKADKETVEKLKNRTSINLIAFNAEENLKKAVNKYNNSNTEYLIKLIEENELSDFDRFVVSGENADIVLWDNKTDMSSYLHNGFFTDLNKYLEENKRVSSDDLLSNIYDACSNSGKTEFLLLDFMAEALIGDSTEWKTNVITYDVLFDSGMNDIFYDLSDDELLEILVIDNINEFIDYENRECHFNTKDFSNILEFIKNNSVDEKSDIVTFEDYEKSNRRFLENECFLQNVSLSKSELCFLRKNVLHNISLFGFPSYQKMYSHIIPNNLIGISEKSKNKEAAWDFISFLLSPSYQENISTDENGLFPINKKSFENTRRSMYDEKNNDIINMMFDYLQNECCDFTTNEHISEIIREQSDMFFDGVQNIDDTIRNIDNKIKIYLNEIN